MLRDGAYHQSASVFAGDVMQALQSDGSTGTVHLPPTHPGLMPRGQVTAVMRLGFSTEP